MSLTVMAKVTVYPELQVCLVYLCINSIIISTLQENSDKSDYNNTIIITHNVSNVEIHSSNWRISFLRKVSWFKIHYFYSGVSQKSIYTIIYVNISSQNNWSMPELPHSLSHLHLLVLFEVISVLMFLLVWPNVLLVWLCEHMGKEVTVVLDLAACRVSIHICPFKRILYLFFFSIFLAPSTTQIYLILRTLK